jgi:hypothetical protein
MKRILITLLALAGLCLVGCAAGFSADMRIPAGTPTPAITVPVGADCIARTRIFRDGQWRKSYAFQRVGGVLIVARPDLSETFVGVRCLP